MFGYVTIDKGELKVKEFEIYHAYYCGLCHRLGALYGLRGQMTLTYDLTFLVMLFTGLYEPKETSGNIRCLVHPLEKHPAVVNRYTDYAAAMNVLLAYYKALDDKADEKRLRGTAVSLALQNAASKVEKLYPRKAAAVRRSLETLSALEAAGETDLDKICGVFGDLMTHIFVMKDDVWKDTLHRFSFFLGKFLYLMDAVEDLQDDLKSGSFNPLIPLYRTREDFDDYTRELLTMMISEAAGAFELLPILKNVTILKNILYSGVWTKYRQAKDKTK